MECRKKEPLQGYNQYMLDAGILTLELRDVIALLRRDSLSLRATGVDIVVSISTALAAAFSNDSDTVVG